MSGREEVTQALLAATGGDTEAAEQLWTAVYDKLRQIAHGQLRRERPNHTLSTTALVHEAYLQLVDQTRVGFQNRSHFYGAASLAMRHILVDYARKRGAKKRGGGKSRVTFDDMIPANEQAEELLALDEALTNLEAVDERLARVVQLRYFGGLREKEIAEMLNLSERTVRRDWTKAKAWLLRSMREL